jgi:hypothetical protein
MPGKESWFDHNYESSMMLACARDKVVPRMWPMIKSKKAIITIVCTGNQLLKLVDLPPRQKYNKEYFMNETLEGSNEECNRSAGYRVTKTMKTHLDNCQVQNTTESWQKIRGMKKNRLVHPPYSP